MLSIYDRLLGTFQSTEHVSSVTYGLKNVNPEQVGSFSGVLAPHQRRIGYVFQDLALWPHMTARQQVVLVGEQVNMTRSDADSLLEAVGLHGLESRRPADLSGGEQQRLAIARALAGKPAVLLLDEPFSSVDRSTRQSLYSLIRKLSPDIPGPTIYVTHSVEDAQELSERAFRLVDGGLIADEQPWAAGV